MRLFLVSVLLLIGCGAKVDDATDGGPAIDASALWLRYCDDMAARSARCGEYVSPTAVAECKAMAPCAPKAFRADGLAVMLPCMSGRACGTRAETCFDPSASPLTPTSSADAFTSACAAKRASCPGTCGSMAPPAQFLVDATLVEFQTCLSLSCSEVERCLQTVYEKPLKACTPTDAPATSDAGAR